MLTMSKWVRKHRRRMLSWSLISTTCAVLGTGAVAGTVAPHVTAAASAASMPISALSSQTDQLALESTSTLDSTLNSALESSLASHLALPDGHLPGGRGDPQYKRALPTADVIIDAGHGGIDGGTFEGDILEKNINLDIARKVYLLLRKSGIRAVLNRNGDYALSDDNRWLLKRSRHTRDLSQRSQLSKEIHAQIVISLHVNWSKNKTARGPLVLHQNEGQSALLAACIQDSLNQQQHTRKHPEIGKPFYLLNVVKQPAVIIEMGFISNVEDRKHLIEPQYQMKTADAIASGVRNYLLIH